VPTQAALNGDFSQLESAACQTSREARTIIDPASGQPFANDYVSPTRFNQAALNFLKDVPTSSDPCGKLTYSIPNPQTENQYVGRMDWNQSAKHNFFGRYFYSNYISPPTFNNNLLLTNLRGVNDLSQSMVLGDTMSITPTTLNSVHVTWTRLSINRGPAADVPSLTDFGVNTVKQAQGNLYVQVNGHFTISPSSRAFMARNAAQLADDLDIVRGRHHISAGVEGIYNQYADLNTSFVDGDAYFNGSFTNDALVDLMLGQENMYSQAAYVPYYARQTYFGAYADDNFQLNNRLSVRLGLRWEPYLPEREGHNPPLNDHFDRAAFDAGQKTSQFTNAPAGLFFAGDPGMPQAMAYSRMSDLAPRVGIIWDPTGSGRQSIRAGYGRFYDFPELEYAVDLTTNPPYGSMVSITAPAGGFTNPWQGYPGGDPYPTAWPLKSNANFVTQGFYYNYLTNTHPTHLDQWDVSYQRQLTNNWLMTVTYMGNKSTHVWTTVEGDPAVYLPGSSSLANTAQRRVLYLQNPVAGNYYSSMVTEDDGANAEYEALLASVQHRFNGHYTLLANYTYSHCISTGDFESAPWTGQTQNPYDRNADRGNCGFDLRHIFNLSFVAQSPRFKNPWTNRLLGNWQLAPIVSLHGGEWFSPWTGYDASLTAVGCDRPNVTGNPYTRNTSTRQWLDPNSFVANTPGTYGDAGSQSLIGPGFFDIDASLSRHFNIKEKQQLELRFEFFNLTNHVNFSTPDNYLSDSTFGQILGDAGPRILQFALKYTF
jgi:hypothetical protein